MTAVQEAAADARAGLSPVADAVVRLGRLSMEFALIQRGDPAAFVGGDSRFRSVTPRLDGTPESDTDHTVMLGLVACALAHEWNEGAWAATRIELGFPKMNVALVGMFSLVHDLIEVKVGDTPTLRITAEEYAAKCAREAAAVPALAAEFAALPWLGQSIRDYEAQIVPETRFVKVADKWTPRFVNIAHDCANLRAYGMTREELLDSCATTQAACEARAGEFTPLMDLGRELIACMGEMW